MYRLLGFFCNTRVKIEDPCFARQGRFFGNLERLLLGLNTLGTLSYIRCSLLSLDYLQSLVQICLSHSIQLMSK